MGNASHTFNVPSPSIAGNAGLPNAGLLTPRRFAVLLFALLFVAYPKIILGTGTFYLKDFGVLGYPTLFYHHECF